MSQVQCLGPASILCAVRLANQRRVREEERSIKPPLPQRALEKPARRPAVCSKPASRQSAIFKTRRPCLYQVLFPSDTMRFPHPLGSENPLDASGLLPRLTRGFDVSFTLDKDRIEKTRHYRMVLSTVLLPVSSPSSRCCPHHAATYEYRTCPSVSDSFPNQDLLTTHNTLQTSLRYLTDR